MIIGKFSNLPFFGFIIFGCFWLFLGVFGIFGVSVEIWFFFGSASELDDN